MKYLILSLLFSGCLGPNTLSSGKTYSMAELCEQCKEGKYVQFIKKSECEYFAACILAKEHEEKWGEK